MGDCATAALSCGTGTGFLVIPRQGETLLLAIRFTTGDDLPDRDPLTITVEGSNAISTTLMQGTSWSTIYSGSIGLDIDPGRNNDGLLQCIPNNQIWYTSYRILITSKRGINSAVQYSEVKLLGQENRNKGKIIYYFKYYYLSMIV